MFFDIWTYAKVSISQGFSKVPGDRLFYVGLKKILSWCQIAQAATNYLTASINFPSRRGNFVFLKDNKSVRIAERSMKYGKIIRFKMTRIYFHWLNIYFLYLIKTFDWINGNYGNPKESFFQITRIVENSKIFSFQSMYSTMVLIFV